MAKMKKKELGKGIRALLNNQDSSDSGIKKEKLVKAKELMQTSAHIPLDQIEINPYQPRTEFDIQALEQLAQSIKLHGLVQPITVRQLSQKNIKLSVENDAYELVG